MFYTLNKGLGTSVTIGYDPRKVSLNYDPKRSILAILRPNKFSGHISKIHGVKRKIGFFEDVPLVKTF